MKYIIIVLLFLVENIYAQSIKVMLDSLSTLDDNELHIVVLSKTPDEKLVLPKVKKNVNYKFFTLFYSWKISKDPKINVLDIQQKDKDILYVDKNNDKNLTNDGKPYIFLHSQNKQYIDINSTKDPNQVVRLVIYREPEIPDSIKSKFVDKNGNLNPAFLKFYSGAKDNLYFKGTKGTFYFDNRVTLRRGRVKLSGIYYNIGLFDYSNNGLYNDKDDLLLIDLNRDGKLCYNVATEVFKLNDVFRIGDSNYKLSYIDKYGKNLVLSKTSDKPTNYYLIQTQSSYAVQKNIIAKNFWTAKFNSLDGRAIKLKNLKGKYVFINIWGEWCFPCVEEIPELKNGYKKWGSKVVFLSFLNTQNIERAEKLISKEKISWPQIKITSKIEKLFRVTGYPTNILIYPDGKKYIKSGPINRTFFDLYVK